MATYLNLLTHEKYVLQIIQQKRKIQGNISYSRPIKTTHIRLYKNIHKRLNLYKTKILKKLATHAICAGHLAS